MDTNLEQERKVLRRRVRMATIGVIMLLLAALALFFGRARMSRQSLHECTLKTPKPGPVTSLRWAWWPPGYLCVYSGYDGREIDVRRP